MFSTMIIHNGYNELFKIGGLTVYTYGLLIAIGLIAAFALFFFLSKKFKLSDKSFDFYSLTVIISIVVGFLFGNLFQAIYKWIDSGFKQFAFNGMSFMGGLIGGVALYIIISAIFAKGQARKDFWKVANMIAPCITIAHGFGRIGCLFGRCCYGVPNDSFLSVKYDNFAHPVLATQLLEALFLFILTGVILFMLLKYKRLDLSMLVYLYGYAVWRFIIEFWRDDVRGAFLIPGLSPSQFQSLVMALIAGALTLYIYYFNKVPFRGKELIGRTYYDVALAEIAEAEKAAAAKSAESKSEVETFDSDEAQNESDNTAVSEASDDET